MMESEVYTHQFSKHLSEKRLIGSRCKKCGRVFLPPRSWCPDCQQADLEIYEFSGKGKLAAFTVVYVAPTAMLAAGYDRKNPYCVGVVELDEGERISAQIFGVDVHHPESIKIGTPLRTVFAERGEAESKKVVLGFEVP
ncbi:MAG: Zn-ribbon domain-containing OB-fold protein [Bellilinea sp.]